MNKNIIGNKPKMKKMFAAVQTMVDHEDPEDSIFEIIGVYASKKAANRNLEKFKRAILDTVPCRDDEDPEDVLLNDNDRTYNWYVTSVMVEV